MIPQFFLVFREGLEAALIISIVAAYLERVGRSEDKKYLYLGTAGAIVSSIVLAIILLVVFGHLEGRGEQIFEGITSLAAAGVLTYMILWMRRNAGGIADSLRSKLATSPSTDNTFAVFTVAFVSVLREGLETVLFLITPAHRDPLGTALGALLGVTAILALVLTTVGTFRRLKPRKTFLYTSVLLLLFSAGLIGYGVHELGEAYENQIPAFLRRQAWNVNPSSPSHPLHEDGSLGSLLKTLFGYDGNPEVLRVGAYIAYWVIIGSVLLLTRAPKRPTRKGGQILIASSSTLPHGSHNST